MRGTRARSGPASAGFGQTVAILLLLAFLAMGLVIGWSSLRDALMSELADTGNAVDSLNQSFAFSGATGSLAAGSTYTDRTDAGQTADPPGDFGRGIALAAPAGEGGGVQMACGAVPEGGTATVTCPAGTTISSIDFASYGTPDPSGASGATCESYSIGACHAANSVSVVESLCLGNPSCNVPATNSTFGDPCVGTFKRLFIEASCS